MISDYSIETILSSSVPREQETTPPATRRRRTRTVFSLSAVKYMEQEFEHGKYPDVRRREDIAAHIGVTEARVQVWFQNRRARNNKRRKCDGSNECTDVTAVERNPVKRRHIEQINGINHVSGMVQRHPDIVTTSCQAYTPICYPMYPPVYPAYPTQYNQPFVVSSLWNLSNLVTSYPQKPENEADASDDFVKRLFRFSARSDNTSQDKHETENNRPSKIVRMVVPTRRATDCSVTELRTTEYTRDGSEEIGITLNDSGLANDSFNDSF